MLVKVYHNFIYFCLTQCLGCPDNCPNCIGTTCDKLDSETLTTIETAATVVSAATYATTIATIIIPIIVVTAGSVVALFLDFLGDIALFQYINVPFPANFEVFMEFFSASILPNFLAKTYDESESVISTIGKFEEYECSRVFLDNCGGGLDKELLAIAVIIVTSLLALTFRSCPKVYSRICKIRDSYRWNGLLAFYLGDFQEYFVFTLLQFKESAKPLISLIIGILLVASYFVWYLYLAIALNRRKKVAKVPRTRSSRDKTPEEEEEIGDIPESMSMVIEEFERKNWYSRNFLLLMFLQNVIVAFVLVFLQNWGTIQAGLYSYIAILYGILVLGAFRPFKEKSQTVTFFISHIVKGCMGCLALALGLDEKWMIFSEDQKNAVGIALITLVGVGIASNALLSVGMIVLKIIDYCRKFRRKREEKKTQVPKIKQTAPHDSEIKTLPPAKPQNSLINNFLGSEDSDGINSRKSSPVNLIRKKRTKPRHSCVDVSQQQQRVRLDSREQVEFNFQALLKSPKHSARRKKITHILFKKG